MKLKNPYFTMAMSPALFGSRRFHWGTEWVRSCIILTNICIPHSLSFFSSNSKENLLGTRTTHSTRPEQSRDPSAWRFPPLVDLIPSTFHCALCLVKDQLQTKKHNVQCLKLALLLTPLKFMGKSKKTPCIMYKANLRSVTLLQRPL